MRYKQLKKVLKRIAAEEQTVTARRDGDTALSNARLVALSNAQWAKTARTAVEHPNTAAATSIPPAALSPLAPPPHLLHHSDRGRSPSQSPPLTAPPSPPPAAAPPTLPSPSSESDPAHLHAFTSVFSSHLSRSPSELLFFTLLDEDLVTVNTFFLRQEEFFLSKWEVLSDQLTALLSQPHGDSESPVSALPERAQRVLERAVKELYRGLTLLRNYRIMNYTAFVKIVKKHDKMGSFSSSTRATAVVDAAHFVVSPLLTELSNRCEQLYSAVFRKGDRRSAANSLRADAPQSNDWMTFRLGALVGLSLALLFVIPFIIQYLHSSSFSPYYDSLPNLAAALPVYRCLGLIYLNLWLWGLCIHLLHTSRINWVFILEYESNDTRQQPQPSPPLSSSPRPRHSADSALCCCCLCCAAADHAKFTEVIHAAAVMTFLWLGSLDLYLYIGVEKATGTSFQSDNPAWFPFALFWFSVFIFFTPLRTAHFRTRLFLLQSLSRVVTAPFSYVTFADMFIGDQLCSLVNIFGDIAFSLCWFFTGDFVDFSSSRCTSDVSIAIWCLAILPYWWRLHQCLRRYLDTKNPRFLGNAAKYTSSIIITLLNLTYHQLNTTLTLTLWIIAAAMGTMYIYFWDIHFDWGLLEASSRSFSAPHPFLRPHLTKHPGWYYFAMVSNLILRVSWVFSISPTYWNTPIPVDYFKSIIFSLEIIRRQQWNLIRLENEHLTNCEQFRVVNIVPLPMDVTDIDAHVHTAPEAALLIRTSGDRDLQEAAKEAEVKAAQASEVPASAGSGWPQTAGVPATSHSSPRSSRRVSLFRRRSSREQRDSSPDSSPEAGSGSSRSSRESSTSPSRQPPHPLLVAANAVALASAGVPGLEEAMRAALKLRESVGLTQPKASEFREALNRELSLYRREPGKGSGKSGDSGESRGVGGVSPSSSGLRSSPSSSQTGHEEERKEGEKKSPSRSGSGGVAVQPRSAEPGPPRMRMAASTPLLSVFDVSHVPPWLAAASADSPVSRSHAPSEAEQQPLPMDLARALRPLPLRSRRSTSAASGQMPGDSSITEVERKER